MTESFAEWARSPRVLLEALRAVSLVDWLGFACFLILMLATPLLERAPIKARRRWRGRLFRGVRSHPALRVLLWICWRSVPPLLAYAVWSTAGRLLQWQNQPGFDVGQNLLLIWAGLRFSRVSLHLLVRRFDLDARVGAQLHWTLLFAAFWLSAGLVMEWLQAPDEVTSLWGKMGHLVIVLSLFGALRRPRWLLALVSEEGRAGRALHAAIANLYTPLVYASLVVALLWVCGFERLAEVFLGRGWALIGLAAGAALFYRHFLDYYSRMLGDREENALQRAALLAGARPGLAVLIGGLAVWLGIRVLELQQPLSEALSLVWIRVGAIAITGDAIWGCIVFLAGAVLLSKWLQPYLAYRVYPNVGVAAGEAYAVNRLLHYALVAGGLIMALNSLGLPPSSLAIILGGLSVGIGFGLQEIANNLASGLILLTSRQVRQGDLISVGDRMGTVREVNLRSTVVTTADNVDLLIPNSKLLGDVLVNWTYSNSVGMAKVKFGVAYGADPDTVIAIALRVANAHSEVLSEPCPEVWVTEFGDSSINYELQVRVDMRASVRPRVISSIYLQLLKEFAAQGIEIPFPQREVRLLNGAHDSFEEANGKPANGRNETVVPSSKPVERDNRPAPRDRAA